MTIHLPKVNGFGGGNGGGGGSSSLPIIVTDSGSSLPVDLTDYELNDTFLNTSDKKIYVANYLYEKNTNTTIYGNLTVNFETGVASGFDSYNPSVSGSSTSYIQRNNLNYAWYGNKTYRFHFKLTSNGTTDTEYVLFSNNNTDGYGKKITSFAIINNKIYLDLVLYPYNGTPTHNTTLLLDYDLSLDTEYFLKITKTGTSAKVELFTKDYDENLILDNTITTDDWNYNQNTNSSTYGYLVSVGGYPFKIGEIYLIDSIGDYLKKSNTLSWVSGTPLTDKTEYADKTNGILYLYQDTELIQIPDIDLSNYKLKAETITISTASVTIANVQANKNYVLSSSALTDITLTACETSFEETSINFTTGSSAPTFTDNASIKWFGGVPEMKANTTYTIVIFNKQAYWQEQENV